MHIHTPARHDRGETQLAWTKDELSRRTFRIYCTYCSAMDNLCHSRSPMDENKADATPIDSQARWQ